MRKLVEKIRSQPESVRRKIFIIFMTSFFVVACILYVFSIKNSIAYSLKERAVAGESLPGEFRLPGLTESVTANVQDLWNTITGSKE